MKTHFLALVCLGLLLGFSGSLFGQVKVNGVLQDSTDHSVLAFANIALLQLPDSSFITGTTTDEFGKFTLKADSGSYFMRISYLGYGTQYLPLELNGSEKEMNIGAIGISKSGENLGEVVITAKKPMYAYEGEKKVYNVSEDPSVQGGVATDALQNAPGVYVDMEGNITLRGVSGVEIWINDKPSRIKAEGLKEFLKQLPANSIEKIEVITNPSARYGAEGTAGIINIVTYEKIKQNQLFSFGYNGSTQTSYSPWVSYVYSNEKFSFNTYLSMSRFNSEGTSNSSGLVLHDGDTIYETTSSSQNEYSYGWMYGHVSLEYEFNKNNNVGIWGGASVSKNDGNSSSSSTRLMDTGDLFEYSNSYTGEGDGQNWYGGLTYEHKFKKEGHKFTIDGYAGNYSSDNLTESSRIFNVQTWENLQYQDDSYYDGLWSGLEFNYENPLGKNRSIEAGVEMGYNTSNNESKIDTFGFDSQEYFYVEEFSNLMDLNTMSMASYITYSDTLWFINYKAGLRHEYAEMTMNSVALNDELYRTYSTLFPTLHLNTKTKNNDNYTLSYSRRVDYPQWQLDPFINRVNPDYLSSGNPYLDPAFTDAFEFGYAHFFKGGSNIMATIYHRRTNLDITQTSESVFDTLLNRYTVYSTWINSGKNIFTGADLTLTWVPKPMFRIMLNTNLYNKDIYADLGDYVVDKEDFTWDSKLIFMLNMGIFRLNIMGIYRAADQNLTGSVDDNYFINATASADLLKRKLSLRLGMMDVFNMMERTSNTSTPTYISLSSSKRKSQYLTFGITFRFGKLELEQKQMAPQGGGGGAPM
ncbi:MAG: outer membrane beta-barrel protein [Bacteroidales bacterium]|nr:outer membrane beta-barrel protein [Bacteroidales bacterium]